jgi:hypothetical protein
MASILLHTSRRFLGCLVLESHSLSPSPDSNPASPGISCLSGLSPTLTTLRVTEFVSNHKC